MQMKRGINIGDHFEVPRFRQKTPFQNPVPFYYFDMIKDLGFDHVRLPVRWSDYTIDNDGYTIESFFLNAVAETIHAAFERGLSVILNVHHFKEMSMDTNGNKDKLYAIWEQLSLFFKEFPETLIFEVMNEPETDVDPSLWNDIQNNTISTIRKENPTRKIMIGGTCWNNCYGLTLLNPIVDSNLIATFHFYEPLKFTHQGAGWSPDNKDFKDIIWEGTENEKKEVTDILILAKEWSKAHGMPVNLGEFGAYSTADMLSRCRWTSFVRREAERIGISFTYWEFCKGFGIYDPVENKLRQPLVDALLK